MTRRRNGLATHIMTAQSLGFPRGLAGKALALTIGGKIRAGGYGGYIVAWRQGRRDDLVACSLAS
jgi:hypothetical protein